MDSFDRDGWRLFDADAALQAWLQVAEPAARAAARAPANVEAQLDCQGTWFVGVDVLDNDPRGALAGGPPLAGAAWDFACGRYGVQALHRGQVSVVYPGYPRARTYESEANLAYRRKRAAAHVDGLLRDVGGRFLRQPHAFVLGVALDDCRADNAPLVVWPGSHRIMAAAFAEFFAGHRPERWPELDVQDAYAAARRRVFAECERVPVLARRGQAILLHRHLLHGISPWLGGDGAGERAVIYFRPEYAEGCAPWLAAG